MSASEGTEQLPGNPMMWVLIGSEIAVFGAALLGFAGARLLHPDAFALGQARLDRMAGAVNTGVLLTSGLFAAQAVEWRKAGRRAAARLGLLAAALLGVAFAIVKLAEYAGRLSEGAGLDSSVFFTLYFLITGFHLLHVLAGVLILGLAARWDSTENLETAAAFWHMVDLIWVLIFPVIYIV